eukprot:TRINITY_DN18936_c0_g1_i1.p2 TRINITY_DN18936_c0_g1~~TRINITY_DN18936_c0_g1_i1.p2  ORF type:complete len:104 (-),score=7.14 TRINITY_DN18936_c0_g1_i1:897-1208(-)
MGELGWGSFWLLRSKRQNGKKKSKERGRMKGKHTAPVLALLSADAKGGERAGGATTVCIDKAVQTTVGKERARHTHKNEQQSQEHRSSFHFCNRGGVVRVGLR